MTFRRQLLIWIVLIAAVILTIQLSYFYSESLVLSERQETLLPYMFALSFLLLIIEGLFVYVYLFLLRKGRDE